MAVDETNHKEESQMSHCSISEQESMWENKLFWKSLHRIASITGQSVSTVSR